MLNMNTAAVFITVQTIKTDFYNFQLQFLR